MIEYLYHISVSSITLKTELLLIVYSVFNFILVRTRVIYINVIFNK